MARPTKASVNKLQNALSFLNSVMPPKENAIEDITITPEYLKAAQEAYDAGRLYSDEELNYELQSTLNFFTKRVRPALNLEKMTPAEQKLYDEWRFAFCLGCDRRFAYAYYYNGIKCCSLDCYELYLKKEMGIKFSRHHDMVQRWGVVAAPAIVPSSALQALMHAFGLHELSSEPALPASVPQEEVSSVPADDDAFLSEDHNPPIVHQVDVPNHTENILPEPDTLARTIAARNAAMWG